MKLDCAATAGVLDSGKMLAYASQAAAVAAALGSGVLPYARYVFGLSLWCWAVSCWFPVRVAIDASLFRAMAEEPAAGMRRLDELLNAWGFAPESAGRGFEERCGGAVRLWKLQAVSIVLTMAGFALRMV